MTKRIVLLQALAATPDKLTALLDNPTQKEDQGDWFFTPVLRHMLVVEERALGQMKRIIAETNPALAPLIPTDSQDQTDILLNATLGEFRAARYATLSFLQQRSPEDWDRPARLKNGEETTLHGLAQWLVDQDSERVNQIRTMRGEK